jgi:hypothetical protein
MYYDLHRASVKYADDKAVCRLAQSHKRIKNISYHIRVDIHFIFCLLYALYTCVVCRTFLCRLRLKCDGTRAETRFRLSAKRTSPFKSARTSVQSTSGSRDVRISGSNAGYTMFRGSVKGSGYPFHSPVSLSLPLPASPCAITFQLESNCRERRLVFSTLDVQREGNEAGT